MSYPCHQRGIRTKIKGVKVNGHYVILFYKTLSHYGVSVLKVI